MSEIEVSGTVQVAHPFAIDIVLQPVHVDTGSDDEEGQLVFANGGLVAVLVRLNSSAHGADRGSWFCEAGVGPCDPPAKQLFATPEEAIGWVCGRVADRDERPSADSAAAAGGRRDFYTADTARRLSMAREHLTRATKLLGPLSVTGDHHACWALVLVQVLLAGHS